MRLLRHLNAPILISCLIYGMALTAHAREPLDIPVFDQQRIPLVIIDNGYFSGIYMDMFREVLTSADIPHRFIPIPKQRARIMFERGETVLSCCDNPAWRTRDDELRTQLFSDAMHNTHDLFVFPPGKPFATDDLNVLKTRKVALVRGYGYRASEFFGTRIDIDSEANMLEFLRLGRADVAIVNENVLQHWLLTHPGAVEPGKCHDNASLHIRVHRKRADLLDPINQSIKRMIESGKREEILRKYLGGKATKASPCTK